MCCFKMQTFDDDDEQTREENSKSRMESNVQININRQESVSRNVGDESVSSTGMP